jgi:CRP-like cAMP-binding protein
MLTLTSATSLQARQSSSRPTPRPPVSVDSLADSLDLMGAPMSFSRNEEIYGEGEAADYLYKVVSGAVRVYRVLDDGRRQIAAFYLPGDMFGMEFGDEHKCSAEAVGTVTVRVFKRSAVVALASRDTDVSRQIWEMTARELQRAQDHMMLLIKSAQERVASFLIEMTSRTSGRDQVDLPMSRQDIADYLGLTIETVSRTMTQLENTAAIGLSTSRRIVLRDRTALDRLTA